MTLLAVHDLRKSFGGVHALRGISFDVGAGEAVALIGPNGAGKTTCFNALGGQLLPDSGDISFDGQDLSGLPPFRIWKLGIGRTFQVAATFASLTVCENIQVAIASHQSKLMNLFHPLRAVCKEESETLLETVGLADQSDRACGLLAYGDLKRLELALALSNRPQLLLMDEPTAGVAVAERAQLMELILQTVRQLGISVLFTEHDMDVVFRHAHRILVLHRGELVADGDPESIRSNPRVRAVYLGTSEDGGSTDIAPTGSSPC